MKKMNLNADKEKKYLVFAFFAVLLLIIYNFNLLKLGSICIIGDEFGYWSTGAYMAGMDWSEVASYNSYYSFGYGFWLSLILRIFNNSISAYRAAILLNSVFVLGIFVLLIVLAKHCLKFRNTYIAIIASFAISLYSGLFFASQSTQCETILAFFYIVEVCFLYWYLSRSSIVSCLLLWFNTVYLYCIHQRAIVVIIALSLIFVLQFLLDKRRWKIFLLGIFICVGLITVSSFIKDILLSNLYLGGKATYSNNYSGQTQKLQILFSYAGIKLFIKGVLGKIYYLGASTFGLFYFGIIYFVKVVINSVKEWRKGALLDRTILWYIFNILTFLGIVMIATIQLLDNRRVDTLIYGRYSEFIIFPVVLGGIYYVMKEVKIKQICWVLVGQFALALIVINQLFIGGYQKVYTNNVSGIASFYHNTLSGTGFIYTCTMATAVVMVIYVLLNIIGRKRKKGIYLSLLLVAGIWFSLGYASAQNQLYSFKEERSDLNLFDFLTKLPDEFRVVYSPYDEDEDEFSYMNADYLQFIAYDRPIHVLEKIKLVPDIKENDFLVTQVSVPGYSIWYRKFTLLAKTPHFSVFVKKDSAAESYYMEKYE